MIILGTNSIKDTGYDVANSVRFNRGDSAYMHKTPSSAGNVDVWTFSAWIKVAETGGHRNIFAQTGGSATSQRAYILLNSSGQLYISQYTGSATNFKLVPNRLLRDESAWYHIVVAVDTTQGTDTNRLKLYINGVQETSFETSDYPSQNLDTYVNAADQPMAVGYDPKVSSRHFGGYMAEVVLIDGQQLAADQFGEFDEDSGIFKPIDVSGLTAGTNGFYLDLEDSSNLGNDAFGGTDLTEVNLAATDQSIDTCTNNFATMNPLDNFHQGTAFSEGNLKLVYTSGNRTWNTCNFALSSGKWYCEILKGETNNDKIGIHYKLSAGLTDRADSDSGAWTYLGGKNYDDGGVKTGGSTITYTIDPSDSGDIVQLFLDLDNNKLYFGVNGTVAHSGVGIDIPAASTLENGHYYIFGGSSNTSETMTHTWNFGSPAVAISSANTDAEGFGSFEFSPSGTFDSASKDFLAICTKNLAEYG